MDNRMLEKIIFFSFFFPKSKKKKTKPTPVAIFYSYLV